MYRLKIALAQIEQTNDLNRNGQKIRQYLDLAARARVQIICFPETQTAGYRVDITRSDVPVQVGQLAALHDAVAASCANTGWPVFSALRRRLNQIPPQENRTTRPW